MSNHVTAPLFFNVFRHLAISGIELVLFIQSKIDLAILLQRATCGQRKRDCGTIIAYCFTASFLVGGNL
jgi:hypothetical protein